LNRARDVLTRTFNASRDSGQNKTVYQLFFSFLLFLLTACNEPPAPADNTNPERS